MVAVTIEGNAVVAGTGGDYGAGIGGGLCALLPGGIWNWAEITNYTLNPDGSNSVPLEDGIRRVIRLKLTP